MLAKDDTRINVWMLEMNLKTSRFLDLRSDSSEELQRSEYKLCKQDRPEDLRSDSSEELQGSEFEISKLNEFSLKGDSLGSLDSSEKPQGREFSVHKYPGS